MVQIRRSGSVSKCTVYQQTDIVPIVCIITLQTKNEPCVFFFTQRYGYLQRNVQPVNDLNANALPYIMPLYFINYVFLDLE
jgi:hypothetical protein